MESDQAPYTGKGFSSFFRPSHDLTVEILYASVRQARRASIPERRKLSNTLLCVSLSAIKDQATLDRVREDVSRHLWRYLGTLGRRSSIEHEDIFVSSEEIAIGMGDRLGLSERDNQLTFTLAEELQVWLVEECRGVFLTYWGRIDAYKGKSGVKVWVRPIERQEKETYEPIQVFSNYYGKLEDEDLIRKLVATNDQG